MMERNFIPGTECSRRRPTPTEFVHLRKWVEEVKRNLKITSITEMTNINQQLEQNAELYVSNIISRVIAQLIGKYGDGFVTLQATADGELKVQLAASTEAIGSLAAGTEEIGSVALLAGTEEIGKLAAGSETIGNVKLAGCTLDVVTADINISSSGDNSIVGATEGQKIYIHCIVFTVGGDVNVTLKKGSAVLSGAMDFGGTNEPRGIVAPHSMCPITLPVNTAFVINLSAAVQVSGYCCYHKE